MAAIHNRRASLQLASVRPATSNSTGVMMELECILCVCVCLYLCLAMWVRNVCLSRQLPQVRNHSITACVYIAHRMRVTGPMHTRTLLHMRSHSIITRV